MHLTDPAGTPDVFLAATGSARRPARVVASAVAHCRRRGGGCAHRGWRSRTLATFARIPNGEYAVFNPDGSTRTVRFTGFWLGRRS
ncbi:MAG: hypothetical protein R2838_26050 [Caldilineaceae bacterium]